MTLRSLAMRLKSSCMAGQAMTEYLIGLAIVTAIVAVPFGGHPSVIVMFLEAVRTAYNRFFVALGLPL